MIIGIGTDIIEIRRIRKAAEKTSFLRKIYTEKELELYRGRNCSADFLAGCFAAKEALAKSFGTGFRGFTPIDVEVLRNDLGKPCINLYNGALSLSKSLSSDKIHVTISNTAEYAAAFVIAEKLPQ